MTRALLVMMAVAAILAGFATVAAAADGFTAEDVVATATALGLDCQPDGTDQWTCYADMGCQTLSDGSGGEFRSCSPPAWQLTVSVFASATSAAGSPQVTAIYDRWAPNPDPSGARDVFLAITDLTCPTTHLAVEAWLADPTVDESFLGDGSCSNELQAVPYEGGMEFALTPFVWEPSAPVPSATTPAASNAAPGESGAGIPGGDVEPIGGMSDGASPAPPAPGAFLRSVASPSAVSTDPGIIAQSALLALLIVFLMPFPAQLVNSTVEENADEIRGWFAPLLRTARGAGEAIGSFWRGPLGIVAFLVLSTLLYAFLDPGFDLSAESIQTLIAIATGIVVVTFLFAIPLVWAHGRLGDRPSVAVLPGTLIIGAACVLISRIVDFQPGYLYGLVIGVAFATDLDAHSEGRSGALAAVLMLLASGVAWVGLGLLQTSGSDGFLATLAQTVLAAILVAGLEGVVFGLLPLRFLPGEPVYRWNRAAWGALVGIGLFAFFHILINPASGYLSDSSRTPLITALALFGGFAVVSIAFWGWFRFRAVPEPAADG